MLTDVFIGINLTAVLPKKWQRYQIKMVRWQLFQVAGKVVTGHVI